MAIGDAVVRTMGSGTEDYQPASGVEVQISALIKALGTDQINLYNGSFAHAITDTGDITVADLQSATSWRGSAENMFISRLWGCKPMPKRIIGPFLSLANLVPVDETPEEPNVEDVLERCYLINAVLAEMECNCNGHAAGHQRDEYWGGDLSELVGRCTSHEILSYDVDGNTVAELVSIKLETLRVEVDSNNEICTWIYEES
jgi:hypothetical protein